MAKVGSLLLLLILIRAAKGNLTLDWSFTRKQENLSLAEVTVHIVRDYLSKLATTIVIAENNNTHKIYNTNDALLEHLLKNLKGNVAVQRYMAEFKDQPWEYYIFIVDSYESFKNIYETFTYNFYERHFRFLIILTKYLQNYRYELMEIFKLCFQFDVIDVNVIIERPGDGVCMYTYFHYSESVCRGFLPARLYKFNEGFENFKTLFPDKLSNFHLCPMRVTTRVVPPFLIYKGEPSDVKPLESGAQLSGLEGEILKFLAKSLNFTIYLLPFQTERSYVQDNKTFGCFTDLRKKSADIAVGSFIGSDPSLWIFSPTSTYHNSPYVFVVRAQKELNSFLRLGRPFQNQVWILLAGVLLLIVIFITCLRFINVESFQFVFGERNLSSVIHSFSMFLGYPICRTPRRNFARYVFMLWLLFTLVLRSAYQGSLYDAIRMDRFIKTPKGYDDLIKWNYTFILAPEIVGILFDIVPNKQLLSFNEDGFTPRLELMESMEGLYATLAIEDAYPYYMEKAWKNETNLIMINEAIFSYQTVMFLPKHSIYLNIFNKKLREFACAGILSKFRTTFTPSRAVFLKYKEQVKKVPLTNKHLMAMYYLYGAMVFVSVIVFGMELASVRYRRLQMVFK